MTVQEFIKLKEPYNLAVDKASDELQRLSIGHIGKMGLVDREITKSESYQKALKEFKTAFSALRNFNKLVPKKLMREASMYQRNLKMEKKNV